MLRQERQISRKLSGDQIIYSELGTEGGRIGPRSEPEKSHYAVVKTEDDEYSKRGPTTEEQTETPETDSSILV